MFKVTVNAETAARIESSEVNAWLDMYAACPRDFACRYGLDILSIGSIVLTRCKAIPFVHFNCVLNLGISEPATEEQVDEVIALYGDAGVKEFAFFHIPQSKPAELREWLLKRNFRERGGWERIYRANGARAGDTLGDLNGSMIEKVTPETAHEWAEFICSTYSLSTKPWLLALAERAGWHHYLLRREGQPAAARSMYVHSDRMAWLGIDAPVPGLMAPSFDYDAMICREMVKDGLRLGVECFVADIEAPSASMATPAYRNFETLGFKLPYFRSHYVCK